MKTGTSNDTLFQNTYKAVSKGGTVCIYSQCIVNFISISRNLFPGVDNDVCTTYVVDN